MFNDMSAQEMLFNLFMVGIMLEFIRMVPPLFMKLVNKVRKALRKVEVQELAEELGGVCKSEDDCNKRLEGTIKALGKEIKNDISEARQEFKSGLQRVHNRIDNHLNKAKVA